MIDPIPESITRKCDIPVKNFLEQARALIPVVRAAGKVELDYFRSGVEVMDKSDGSPVTLADQDAEKLIAARLHDLFPHIPMVGEESVAAGTIPDISGGTFWLVDPLDGTKEFISGGGDFTVNIALIVDFIPVIGVVYVPFTNELYFAADGEAFMSLRDEPARKITVREVPAEGLTVVASKRHGDPERLADFLGNKKVAEVINRSSSLKFCVIAAGQTDFYPRLGPTCEWDTAAGDAILRAAGGQVTTLDGQVFSYGHADRKFLNPEFLAFSGK